LIRQHLLIFENSDLKSALTQMDKGGYGVLFVINDKNQMVGLVTDGDLRKGFLRGVELTSPLVSVMNREFAYGKVGQSESDLIQYLRKIKRRHLPLLDDERRLVDVILLDDIDFVSSRFETASMPIVLMVVGRGERLGILTAQTPKPMISVGGRPMLENILNKFILLGFKSFYLCVNYKSEIIESHFGDGSKWNVKINYVREEMPLGTAGGLSLLRDKLKSTFVVMNGDLLTDVNFLKMLEFHVDHKCQATMAVQRNKYEVPFGVVEFKDSLLTKLVEKPVFDFFVNAGIYVLEPNCLNFIPNGEPYQMPELLSRLVDTGNPVSTFPLHEYWRDIGRPVDLQQALDDSFQILET
jgi:dTDP-glucose pyrophosphorylase